MDTRKAIALAAALRGKANSFLKAKLAERGLSEIDPSYGAILNQLFINGERTMMQLATAVNRDKSTITALVGRLENLGVTERRRNPDDGRSWIVALTAKGDTLREPFKEISDELLDAAYRGFSEEEKNTVTTLLERMTNNL